METLSTGQYLSMCTTDRDYAQVRDNYYSPISAYLRPGSMSL